MTNRGKYFRTVSTRAKQSLAMKQIKQHKQTRAARIRISLGMKEYWRNRKRGDSISE